MKCPVCQAKLLPVDGEYFCLQCGVAVHEHSSDSSEPASDLAATTDPLLRRAIADATDGEVVFVDEPAVLPPSAPVVRAASKGAHHPPSGSEGATAEDAGSTAKAAPRKAVADTPAQAPRTSRMASLRALMAPPRPETSGAFAIAGGVAAGPSLANPLPAVKPGAGDAGADLGQGAGAPTPAVLRRGALFWPVTIATVLVGSFVAANFWASSQYASRVLPGVSVGSVDLGGVPFAEIEQRLNADIPAPGLSVAIGSETRVLETAGFARLDVAKLRAEVEQAGRNSPLPVARLLGGFMATKIEPRYVIDELVISRTVEQIAASVDEKPTSAVAVMYSGNALLLADKPGRKLNRAKAEASLKAAYGKSSRVTLTFDREDAAVRAGALSDDIVQASSRVAAGLDVVVKGRHYVPTPTQLAEMLVFAGPGKGVSVNQAAVGAYISGIPGNFDRAGAVNGITNALNSGRGGTINVVSKSTKLPNLVSSAVALPVQTYRYCFVGTPEQVDALRSTTTRVLGAGAPWTLGGRVAFAEARTECNLRLGQGDVAALRVLDPACATQTTCRSHNSLLIHDAAWQAAPRGWTAGLAGYREELVGHVIGQWLGFEHSTCGEVPTRPLSSPALTIPGCSPLWYSIGADSQDTKILPGF